MRLQHRIKFNPFSPTLLTKPLAGPVAFSTSTNTISIMASSVRTALLEDVARGRPIPDQIRTRPWRQHPPPSQAPPVFAGLTIEELEYYTDDHSTQGWVPLRLAKLPQSMLNEQRLPTAILLHATGVDMNSVAEQQADFARRGYLAAAIDCRYHGMRALSGIDTWEGYQQALVRAWREGPERPFLLDNVWDLQRLLDVLQQRPDVDVDRIGVTGISLGGMHTWLLTAADPRVAVAAPMIGFQNFGWALKMGKYHGRVDSIPDVFQAAQQDLNKTLLDPGTVETVWRTLLPGLLDSYDAELSLPSIAPRPFAIINGEVDPRCPMQGVRIAVAAAREVYVKAGAGDNLYVFVDKGEGHECTSNMLKESAGWLDKHLLKKAA